MVIRSAKAEEAAHISNLALRSKAHWGYSQEFLDACRAELTYHPSEIEGQGRCFNVAELSDVIVGFYVLERESDEAAELAALFVEPSFIGRGIGRALFEHALMAARENGSVIVTIQSDPYAADFYRSMGARQTGLCESGSIPNRYLPTFAMECQVMTR